MSILGDDLVKYSDMNYFQGQMLVLRCLKLVYDKVNT